MCQEVRGKGRGLVARQSLKEGDLILTDRASLVLSFDQINNQFVSKSLEGVKEEERRKFLDLRGKVICLSSVLK